MSRALLSSGVADRSSFEPIRSAALRRQAEERKRVLPTQLQICKMWGQFMDRIYGISMAWNIYIYVYTLIIYIYIIYVYMNYVDQHVFFVCIYIYIHTHILKKDRMICFHSFIKTASWLCQMASIPKRSRLYVDPEAGTPKIGGL